MDVPGTDWKGACAAAGKPCIREARQEGDRELRPLGKEGIREIKAVDVRAEVDVEDDGVRIYVVPHSPSSSRARRCADHGAMVACQSYGAVEMFLRRYIGEFWRAGSVGPRVDQRKADAVEVARIPGCERGVTGEADPRDAGVGHTDSSAHPHALRAQCSRHLSIVHAKWEEGAKPLALKKAPLGSHVVTPVSCGHPSDPV